MSHRVYLFARHQGRSSLCILLFQWYRLIDECKERRADAGAADRGGARPQGDDREGEVSGMGRILGAPFHIVGGKVVAQPNNTA